MFLDGLAGPGPAVHRHQTSAHTGSQHCLIQDAEVETVAARAPGVEPMEARKAANSWCFTCQIRRVVFATTLVI